MPAGNSWKTSYSALLTAITSLGHPKEFGALIARELGSEKMMDRMTNYLRATRPRSAEEIADEMLAILSDRNRWIRKKENEYYNARYNRYLNEKGEEDGEP